MALPTRIEFGADGVLVTGVPVWTMPAGVGAGAFSGGFFLTVSPPETRRDVPSRIERGISIIAPSEQVGALDGLLVEKVVVPV
jgi:hypothetical protein